MLPDKSGPDLTEPSQAPFCDILAFKLCTFKLINALNGNKIHTYVPIPLNLQPRPKKLIWPWWHRSSSSAAYSPPPKPAPWPQSTPSWSPILSIIRRKSARSLSGSLTDNYFPVFSVWLFKVFIAVSQVHP